MIFINVDFPAPLGPSKPKISPFLIFKDKSLIAIKLLEYCIKEIDTYNWEH